MTTPAKQTLREFEKAFQNKSTDINNPFPDSRHGYALWAARWMAKYIKENLLDIDEVDHQELERVIKELS